MNRRDNTNVQSVSNPVEGGPGGSPFSAVAPQGQSVAKLNVWCWDLMEEARKILMPLVEFSTRNLTMVQ